MVYGGPRRFTNRSQTQVIERILRQQMQGNSLLGFGDGYVEIQNVKAAGGTGRAVPATKPRAGASPTLEARSADRPARRRDPTTMIITALGLSLEL